MPYRGKSSEDTFEQLFAQISGCMVEIDDLWIPSLKDEIENIQHSCRLACELIDKAEKRLNEKEEEKC